MKPQHALVAVALFLFVCLSIACEVTTWNECRASNSWIYCMRVMGR